MVTLGDQTEWQENKLEHLRYEYDLKPSDVVFDIGSYRNEFGDKIKQMYGCKIEPFDALDNKAAWITNGTIKTGGQYYYSSQFIPGETEHSCVDIKEHIGKYDRIALLKINIEGAEYVLLSYIIEQGLMERIENLQVQFHLIEGFDCELLYSAIKEKLEKTHSLAWRYPFVWESWKRC